MRAQVSRTKRNGTDSNPISHAQLARLFRIVLHLQVARFPRAEQLADLCGVSRRTAYRDLETLTRAGLPIRYRADCMGYEFDPNFWMAPLAIAEDELLALVAHTCVGPRDVPNEFRLLAYSAIQKCVASQPLRTRTRARALFARLQGELARTPEAGDAPHGDVLLVLLNAIGNQRQVRLSYRDPNDAACDSVATIQTRVNPHRLSHDRRGWVLEGRSSFHRKTHAFAVERIVAVSELDEPAALPARLRKAE